MIIDFHTHVFPAFFRNRRPALFTHEPAFETLYRSPQAKLVSAKELLRNMDAEGVQKSVILGFPWEKEDHYRRHNDYIIEAVQRNRDRLIGFCCFSPLASGGPREIERCVHSGISGVGELAVYKSGLSSRVLDKLKETMALCAHFDVPVLVHTNEPVGHDYAGKTPITLRQIYRFLKNNPSNQIVLAHWGGGIFFYAFMKKEVRDVFENVWFDTAASPYLYTPHIYRVAGEAIGFGKILFGSDYPLLSPQRYVKEMVAAGLSPHAVDMVKGVNAAKLLGL